MKHPTGPPAVSESSRERRRNTTYFLSSARARGGRVQVTAEQNSTERSRHRLSAETPDSRQQGPKNGRALIYCYNGATNQRKERNGRPRGSRDGQEGPEDVHCCFSPFPRHRPPRRSCVEDRGPWQGFEMPATDFIVVIAWAYVGTPDRRHTREREAEPGSESGPGRPETDPSQPGRAGTAGRQPRGQARPSHTYTPFYIYLLKKTPRTAFPSSIFFNLRPTRPYFF
ncbi:hypothetical protein WMY93_014477 [Mugilogobius chulae]|uniref:Uncharacterized protein n=1 Tax=Mugilogobius chulae TaxID=88201 RepID=A0AAW0P4K1_9GOBI